MSSNRYSKCRAMHPKSRANEIQRTQYVEPRHLRTQVIHRHEGKEDHKTKIARLFRYGAYPICRANALSPGSPYLKDRANTPLSDFSGTPERPMRHAGGGSTFQVRRPRQRSITTRPLSTHALLTRPAPCTSRHAFLTICVHLRSLLQRDPHIKWNVCNGKG